MAHLLAIMDEGGRTLLVKAAGDIQAPSFPTLGLLCSIATFASSKGYTVDSFHTSNVQIVYQGFAGSGLLLVLATSNLLLPKETLKQLLRAIYAGVRLTVGKQLLGGSDAHNVDALKRKLRGVAWLEQLVQHDAVLPCVMLPGPQWLAAAPHEVGNLHATLTSLCSTLTGNHEPPQHKRQQVLPQPQQQLFAGAAVLREGLYVCCSASWELLPSTEQLLLQHMAAHLPGTPNQDAQGGDSMKGCAALQVYITCMHGQEQHLHFVITQLAAEGAQLLLLCSTHLSMDELQSASRSCVQQLDDRLKVPTWCAPPVPGISATLANGHCPWPELVIVMASNAAQHSSLLESMISGYTQVDSPRHRRRWLPDTSHDQDSHVGTPTRHHRTPSHSPTHGYHHTSPPACPSSKLRMSQDFSVTAQHSRTDQQQAPGLAASRWQGPPAGSMVLHWCAARPHLEASLTGSSCAGLGSPISGGTASFNPLVSPSLIRQLRSASSTHSFPHRKNADCCRFGFAYCADRWLCAHVACRTLSMPALASEALPMQPGPNGTTQVYFRACCDLVAAFMLGFASSHQAAQQQLEQQDSLKSNCDDSLPATPKTSRKDAAGGPLPWHRASHPTSLSQDAVKDPVLQKHNSTPPGAVRSASSASIGTPTTAVKQLANRFFGAFTAMGWVTPRANRKGGRHSGVTAPPVDISSPLPPQHQQLQETQILADGKRLVALTAPPCKPGTAAGQHSASVYLLCTSAAADRQAASQTARHLHATVCSLATQ